MRITSTVLALLTIVAGCAKPLVAEHSTALDRAPVCCRDFADVQSSPLVAGSESRTEVSLKSPVFEFPEGKSYFVAYRLPDAKTVTRRTLVIRTFTVNTTPITAAHVFVPRVITADQNLKPLRSTAPTLQLHRPRFAIGESWWQGELALDPSEAYAFVYTGREERKRVLQMPDSDAGAVYAPIPGGGGVLIPNARGYRLIPAGPTGEVAVRVNDG